MTKQRALFRLFRRSSRVLITGAMLIAFSVTAHACEPGPFVSSAFSGVKPDGWQVDIDNALVLTYPFPPTRVEMLGNLLTIRFADGSGAALTTRTVDELNSFGEAAKDGAPAFWRRVFTTAESVACEVSAAMQLAKQDYRIHLVSHGFDIYAFGRDRRHEFYAIPRGADGEVIHGLFTGMPRATFESILSTATTQDQ